LHAKRGIIGRDRLGYGLRIHQRATRDQRKRSRISRGKLGITEPEVSRSRGARTL
jgi:hypothetical protein